MLAIYKQPLRMSSEKGSIRPGNTGSHGVFSGRGGYLELRIAATSSVSLHRFHNTRVPVSDRSDRRDANVAKRSFEKEKSEIVLGSHAADAPPSTDRFRNRSGTLVEPRWLVVLFPLALRVYVDDHFPFCVVGPVRSARQGNRTLNGLFSGVFRFGR